MEVTEVMTMQEYQRYCEKQLPIKIPNWKSRDYRRRVGDCIYDFLTSPPRVLESVHDERNRQRDLGGKCALLSDHFYYFGDKPEPLPPKLLAIIRQGQGHKSTSNTPYFHDFVEWILTQTKAKNKVYSEPNSRHAFATVEDYRGQCAARDKEQDEFDEELGDE